MTGDTSIFIDFTRKERGFVSYGDNNQGKILGKGVMGKPSTTTIKDVMLVDGLKHNSLVLVNFATMVRMLCLRICVLTVYMFLI